MSNLPREYSWNSVQRCAWYITCVFGGVFLGTLWGCAASSTQETYAIQGKVSVGKKVLTGGTLMFQSSEGNIVATEVGTNGAYQTQLTAGRHRVAVQLTSGLEQGKSAKEQFGVVSRKSPIPSKYLYFESSGLNIDVKSENDNTHDIQLH